MKINIDNAVDKIFNQFDINKNGEIEFKNKEVKTLNIEKENRKKDDNDSFGTDYYRVEEVDHTKLFKNADINDDGIITKSELKNHISKYDKNKDNKLDTNPFDFFGKSKKEGNIFDQENRPKTTTLTYWSSFRPSPKELEDLRNRK